MQPESLGGPPSERLRSPAVDRGRDPSSGRVRTWPVEQLDEAQRELLRELLRTHASHQGEPARGAVLGYQLQQVAERAGLSSVHELLACLHAPGNAHLRRAVAEAMTVKETSFFRDRASFQMLRDDLLPELIQRRAQERTLRFWSAACATGQEPWSLAMLLRDCFPRLVQWDVRILGSDLSGAACEHAARGRYSALEVSRGLPDTQRLRHFIEDTGEWVVRDHLRRHVQFQRLNLCRLPPDLPQFDVVLLRNVLLYFAPDARIKVLRAVHARMSPGGVLLLGNAERAEGCADLFRLHMDKTSFAYIRL